MERNQFGAIEFNPMATGAKRYGASRGMAATSGPLPAAGYDERSRKLREKRLAAIRSWQNNGFIVNNGQQDQQMRGF